MDRIRLWILVTTIIWISGAPVRASDLHEFGSIASIAPAPAEFQ